MATSYEQIKQWVESAKEEGATHVIIVCDTFDHEDYPVSVMPNENVRECAKQYRDKNMQRIMEIYSMALPIEEQLNERRAFHLD